MEIAGPLPQQDLDHVLEHARDSLRALAGARLFLTGGTGFVGTWLLESLLYANDRFGLGTSAVVLTRDVGRFRALYPHLAGHGSVEVLPGDLRTFVFPEGEFQFVIHAATPDPDLNADREGTAKILEFAGAHGARRFLFTSSGAAYGPQPPELERIPEDYAAVPAPGSLTGYAQAKRAAEAACLEAGRRRGFSVLIARLFAFSGPRLPLDRNFAIGNFIRDVLAGGPIRIQGDGTPYRSYLYAADLAVWLWTILARGDPARIYNVGSDRMLSIAELARTVAAETAPGTAVEIAQKPCGAAAARYVPSVERAGRELGLRAEIELEQGIRRTYEWAMRTGARVVCPGRASTSQYF